jgi:hypothetical protein
MPRLLVVHHTPSPALQAMFEAAVSGARTDEIEGVEVVVRPALTAAAVDVLEADAYLFGTPVQLALATLQRFRPARNQPSTTALAVVQLALPAVVDRQGDAPLRGRTWSRAAHQSRWSHLRGKSGRCGNFGQLGLPGITAKAGFTAVISGWRNGRAVCRLGGVAGGISAV